MRVMKFKKFLSMSNIKESIKELELNKILDKISSKSKLSQKEEEFLNKYDSIRDEDIKDYQLLSPETAFNIISQIIKKNKPIICNITDNQGKIGKMIKSVFQDYKNELFEITLSDNTSVKMKDNFLYNIIYDISKDRYSLEIQDEYFEKIPIKNE